MLLESKSPFSSEMKNQQNLELASNQHLPTQNQDLDSDNANTSKKTIVFQTKPKSIAVDQTAEACKTVQIKQALLNSPMSSQSTRRVNLTKPKKGLLKTDSAFTSLTRPQTSKVRSTKNSHVNSKDYL